MISYEISIGLILMNILITVGSLNLRIITEFQESVWLILPFPPLFILFFISTLAETNRAPFDLPEAEGELVAGFNVEYSSASFALFFIGEYVNIFAMSTLSVLLFFGSYISSFMYLPLTPHFPLDFIFWFFEIFYVDHHLAVFALSCDIHDYIERSPFFFILFSPIIGIFEVLRFKLLYYFFLPSFILISYLPAAAWFVIKINIIVFFFLWVRASVPRFRYDALMRLTWKVFLPFVFGYLIFTASFLFLIDALPRV